jgi:UDP-glucose 4-epimerase/UDP-glucuronate decarboxylase
MSGSSGKKRARHLVTGAAGVIGFELVRQLLAAGDEVVAVDLFKKGGRADLEKLASEHSGALEILEYDLARSDSLSRTGDRAQIDDRARRGSLPRERFDTIFHFAAIVGVRYVMDHPYETVSVNMRSTLSVLDHAVAHGCSSFFFASSSENYASGADAGQVEVPTPENVTLSIADIELPRWSYAASKICGESAVFGAAPLGNFTPVVVRFHNVYGPRMGPTHVIPEMLARCKAKTDPFPIFGAEQTRSFLYIEDAGRALMYVLAAARAKKGGLYNIGAPLETKIGDLAKIVFEVTGHKPKLDLKPAPKGSVQRRVPNIAKIAKLGFAPRVSLLDGVRTCWRA